MAGMSNLGDKGPESRQQDGAQGSVPPVGGGAVRPYTSGSAVPGGAGSQPPARVDHPGRLPIVLETRPIPRPAGTLLRAWSHPLAIALILLLILLLIVSLAWALLREPQALEGAATASASPSPSPTASEAIPPTQSPENDLTPSAPVDGSPQPGLDGASPPASGGPPPFGDSEVGPRSGGSQRVGIDHLEFDVYYWSEALRGDLSATRGGIVGHRGTAFALIDTTTTEPNFETCRAQKTWTAVINWSQMQLWSMLCIKTKDKRRGIMRIDQMPDLESAKPSVVLTGQIWSPTVNA